MDFETVLFNHSSIPPLLYLLFNLIKLNSIENNVSIYLSDSSKYVDYAFKHVIFRLFYEFIVNPV